ncbi:metallophosphoesterase [Polaribacter sp. Hel1_33_49]|uniref:metallophosphoesterase n=1 Tax=Polaribacter sp. Hel1_33_49 TaxID=1336803 RepID=UPI00052C4612|nr:metallophosphoesterase [Polaribacter sp. Hel1_33_49]KGL60036.1 metallophosphoesterase [Polaribacter sp. Hel1_33_49]MDG1398989.1 metallophosphoesterase [Polaribacter sp.]
MKSYSLFTIFLLCLAILAVDILAFYWLQSITQLINSESLKTAINIIFWIFTAGLVILILLLKVTLEDINPRRKHLLVSSLSGLTISSFIPKLIFVVIISILFFSNFVFSEKESLIIIPLIGLCSGFLPFFVILYGFFRALYRFKVHHVTVKHKKLPKPFNGLKIIQISDIHLGSFNYKYHILDKAIKVINDAQPDFIFFTGDLVNNYAWELIGWEKVFKKLIAKKGKYAILGNHDYGDYSEWNSAQEKQDNFEKIKEFYKTIDFKLLLNQSEIIEKKKGKLAIIGVENWGKAPFKQYGNLQEALKNVSEIPFKILLSHDPTHWREEVIKKTGISLTLSGHTHGMQVGFQYKKMKWSPIKYKYKHWAGLYNENEKYLYVNRGLGWVGFPGRLGMRPEITLFKLFKK